MIRPNTIGSVGHYPACANKILTAVPHLENWKHINTTFESSIIDGSEYSPGVNSFALLSDGTAITIPASKQFAYHMPINMVPDDSRPGYPFIVSVKGQIHLELVAGKAVIDCQPFVGFANIIEATHRSDVYYATCLPAHVSISDQDTVFVDGVIDQTFTVALPPTYDTLKNHWLCIGFIFRTRSGIAQWRVVDCNLSSHVLYQNRPCYDPSIS